jgi:hypothetical protein
MIRVRDRRLTTRNLTRATAPPQADLRRAGTHTAMAARALATRTAAASVFVSYAP